MFSDHFSSTLLSDGWPAHVHCLNVDVLLSGGHWSPKTLPLIHLLIKDSLPVKGAARHGTRRASRHWFDAGWSSSSSPGAGAPSRAADAGITLDGSPIVLVGGGRRVPGAAQGLRRVFAGA